MPLQVPPDIMRVRLRATLSETSVPIEEAQFGFWGQRVHEPGNPTDWAADVQEAATKIRDKWNQHIVFKHAFSPDVIMESVKVDHLKASDGSVLDQGVATFDGTHAWQGDGGPSMPWETTLCLSLFGYKRGVFSPEKGRKRGRMYLPPMSSTILAPRGGEIDVTPLQGINQQFGAFFNDVQGMEFSSGSPEQAADYFNLVVVSRGTPARPLPPMTYAVTYMYVDSKFDSQRRRESQQGARQELFAVIEHS